MTSHEPPAPLTGLHDEPPRLPPPKPPAPDAATRAQRIAGALLLINAVLIFTEVILVKDAPQGPASALKSPTTWIVPALIDIGIGVSLLIGKRTLVPWAILRSVGGVVLGAALHLSTNNPLGAVMTAVLCAALLALLIGEAGRLRIGLAVAGSSLVWLIEVVGLSALVTGVNPLGRLVMSMSGSIEGAPVAHVTGVSDGYSIDTPNDKWHLRTAAAARKDNPIADRWLVRPDLDAHVLVIAERAPGGMVAIEQYADTIVANSTRTMKGFVLEKREPWSAYPEHGRLLRGAGTAEGLELVYVYGLVAGFERAYQVVGFAPKRAPAEALEEIAKIIDTLKLPPDVRFVPADVEPEPAGRVVGVSYGYTLEAPSDAWHKRTAEAVRKDNPIADLWLVRPDLDAHVLIVAEHEPGAVIPIDAYTDTILESAKKVSGSQQVIERRAWRAAPESGRFVHTTSSMSGQSIDHYYGLIAIGDRAFQIIGFASSGNFQKAEPEIRALIESFKLPPDIRGNAGGARAPVAL